MTTEDAKKKDPAEPDADDKPGNKGKKMPWDPAEPDDDDKKGKKSKALLDSAREISRLR
jgi:hypothetical protein